MARRTDLHEQLCILLASLGAAYWHITEPDPGKTMAETIYDRASERVYYQPPENVKMKYPCLVYEKSRMDKRHANDKRYMEWQSYTITAIDRDPDGKLPGKLLTLQYCAFDRRFVTENLYHDVFTIYI